MKEDNVTISHLVAASENNVIGKGGGMAWHLPDDFRYFKNTTWAMPVIMGRKTFESMKRALPGRINIVITRSKNWNAEEVFVAGDIGEAIKIARDADTKEIFIIGGGRVFAETMNIIDKIYLTRVHAKIEGDTRYPEINWDEWVKVSDRFHPADRKHPYPFTFEVWERK